MDKVTVGETDVTVYAVWVYGDPVDPVDPPEPPTWDHSKDKTATELDNNFNSREMCIRDSVSIRAKTRSSTGYSPMEIFSDRKPDTGGMVVLPR